MACSYGESLETGIAGFGKDFGTTASFCDAGTDELFDIIKKGAHPMLKCQAQWPIPYASTLGCTQP